MRRLCVVLCIAAAVLLPSTASAARAASMPLLSRTGDSAARLSGELAVLARARARASEKVQELPRTGGAPGLIALLGLGLGLTGAGMRRLRPPL